MGIEARATAHYWGRQLMELGHEVKLMPPSYVKPYVKRPKNEAADAEAICEAVTRPSMRFVEVKRPEQHGVLVVHRTRMTVMRHRIELSNLIRPHMAEWIGLVPRQNCSGGKEPLGGITKQGNKYLRRLLVAGALPVIRYAERHGTKRPWCWPTR